MVSVFSFSSLCGALTSLIEDREVLNFKAYFCILQKGVIFSLKPDSSIVKVVLKVFLDE